MRARPLTLKQANAFIAENHRHHKPVTGHRFTIAAEKNGVVCGFAVVGRPVARMVDPYTVAEVTRLCTDGTRNACSFLYSACARAAAAAMGFEKIQTYILDSEDGTTLKAAGWKYEYTTSGGQWKHTDGKPRRTDQPTQPKQLWSRQLT